MQVPVWKSIILSCSSWEVWDDLKAVVLGRLGLLFITMELEIVEVDIQWRRMHVDCD